MKLQRVDDRLVDALGITKHLEDSPLKEALVQELTRARADLLRFSESMQATLDNLKERYGGS